MSGAFDFAIDLPYGQEAERYVEQMLKGVLTQDATVEVKRDDRALQTGNVYLEFEQLPRGHPPWQPSGLASTEASHFAVVLGNTVVIAPTEAWKHVGNEYGSTRETGGDNPTRGRVVPIEHLVRRLSEGPF